MVEGPYLLARIVQKYRLSCQDLPVPQPWRITLYGQGQEFICVLIPAEAVAVAHVLLQERVLIIAIAAQSHIIL